MAVTRALPDMSRYTIESVPQSLLTDASIKDPTFLKTLAVVLVSNLNTSVDFRRDVNEMLHENDLNQIVGVLDENNSEQILERICDGFDFADAWYLCVELFHTL